MEIRIPQGFDTKVVTGGTSVPYLGKGMKELGIERCILEVEVIKPKYIEPRNGGQLAAFELRVDSSTDERVHGPGQTVSYNTDLNTDNGQVDCKRFVAKLLGGIAARAPGYEETRDSAGNVIKREPRFAVAEDPNAVTSKDLIRALTPGDKVHNALIGTRLRAELYLARYTPKAGKNIGKEMCVERVSWTVLSRSESMNTLQAAAQAQIDALNAKFKAQLEGQQAA